MKNLSRFVFVTSFVVFSLSFAAAQQTAESFYKQGMEQIKAHKYDAAIVQFSQALKLNPRMLEAYLERAKARENNQRDLDGALADIEKVIELNPSHGEAFYERSIIRGAQLVKKQDLTDEEILSGFKKNVADLDLAINYGYKTKDAYVRRAGLKCHDLDDCQSAIADYNAAIQLDANDFFLYINRSSAKRRVEDFTGAVADLREVIDRFYAAQTPEIDEKQKQALEMQRTPVAMSLLALSNQLMFEESPQAALDAINQSMTILPNYASAYEARGVYKTIFGDLSEAVTDFDKAIELRQNNGIAYLQRGVALALLGKAEEAQKSFDKGYEILPHLKNQFADRVEIARLQREQKKVKVKLPE